MSDKSSEPQSAAGALPPAGLLPIYSTADLANSPEGVGMLAGSGALTRSPAGGYKLQIQLQEDKSNSAAPSVTAGTPLRALAQDSLAQNLGHTTPDAATKNAIDQRPGSPVGTISSPYLASDASARLINSMSEIYTALSNTQKYTNQSYANYIEQQFSLTSAELQSINEKYDGERQRLLGALAGANMALIGAIVSAGVNLAVSSASLMSPTRREGDPVMQPEGALRDRAQKPNIGDQRRESDEALRSSLTLHPQEVEAHVDPLNRGDRSQSPTSVTNAAHMPGATQTGRAASVARSPDEDRVLEEPSELSAGDNQVTAPAEERADYRAQLQANANQLENLNARAKELAENRSKTDGNLERGQSSLDQLSRERASNEGEIDNLHSDLSAIGNQRNELKSRGSALEEEGSRLQSALDGLKSEHDPRALQADLGRLKGQRADLQKDLSSTKDQLVSDRDHLGTLEQQRGRLADERASLQSVNSELSGQKAEAESSLSKLQEAKAAIDPKVLKLFSERPNLAELFSRKSGPAPNRIEINSSDSKLTAMGSNSAISGSMRQEMANLHGRKSPTGEYAEWNNGVAAFMKNHGGGTTAERKNSTVQFNDAWKKGIDLNKLEQNLTVKGAFVNPKELDAKIDQAKSEIGGINTSLARNQGELNENRGKLNSHDQQIEIARFDIGTKQAHIDQLDQRLGRNEGEISRTSSNQEQLKNINHQRDALGDRIAANKSDREKNSADLLTSDDAFDAKSKNLTDHQVKNEQLRQRRSDVNAQIAHDKVTLKQTENELRDVNGNQELLTQKRDDLKRAQAEADQKIMTRMSSLNEKGDAAALSSPRALESKSAETPSAALGPEDRSEIEPVSPPLIQTPPAIPSATDRDIGDDRLSLEPEGAVTSTPKSEVDRADESQAAQALKGGGGDPGAIPSKLKNGLNTFFNLISTDGFGGLLMDAGRRSGDIIKQLGAIQQAQMGIQANDLQSAAEQGEAYIETTKELLDQLIEVTGENSKDLDKQMQSLLEVMMTISKTKTEMYDSLFLGR